MNQNEYIAELSSLYHEIDKITRDNTNPSQEQQDQIRSFSRLCNDLRKDFKLHYHYTLVRNFSELHLLTYYIEDTKALEQVFSYYDNRDKTYAIIPKSLYTNKYIHDTRTKQVPKDLKRFGARGYEILLQDFAYILHRTTSRSFIEQENHAKYQAKLKRKHNPYDSRASV